jgi:carboxypeptidase T
VTALAKRLGGYPSPEELEQRWRTLAADSGGNEQVIGRSVAGRALWRFDLGRRDAAAPAVLLTALIHGNEVVSTLALLDVIAALAGSGDLTREPRRLVVMPIVNPDGLAATLDRLQRGRPAGRRGNAHGVDLNRNFPEVLGPGEKRSWNPLAGSSWRRSPWFRGAHPLSEPETQAVAQVAREVRPSLALAFHSFGQLLLHPWACRRDVHPRAADYRALGDAFLRGRPGSEFKVRQAASWYPMLGNLDDWLDASFGTLALTVEVGRLDRRLLHPRAANPFWWANPVDPAPALAQVTPGVLGLLAASRT